MIVAAVGSTIAYRRSERCKIAVFYGIVRGHHPIRSQSGGADAAINRICFFFLRTCSAMLASQLVWLPFFDCLIGVFRVIGSSCCSFKHVRSTLMIAGGHVSAVLAGVCELIAVGFSRWWRFIAAFME